MDVKVFPHLSQHHVRSYVNMELKRSSIWNVTSICKWVTSKVSENFEKISYLQDMISFRWSIWRQALADGWNTTEKQLIFHRQLKVLILYSLPNWAIAICYGELLYRNDCISPGHDFMLATYISSLNGCEGAATIKPAPCKLWCQSGIVRFEHWKCRIHL